VSILPDLLISDRSARAFESDDQPRALAELAWNPYRQTPFMVAAPGERGETGLLHQTRRLLEGPPLRVGARKVRTLRFNAWQYPDHDSLLVGLLGALLEGFRRGRLLDQLGFRIDGHHSRLARRLLHAAAPWAFANYNAQTDRQAGDTGSEVGGTDRDRFWDLYRDLFLQAAYLLFHDTASLQDQGGVVPEALWDQQTRRRYTLAIFLEDLERCREDRLLEVLEALRLFLDLPGVCLFLDLNGERLLGLLSGQPPGYREAVQAKLVHLTSPVREVSAGDVIRQDESRETPEGPIAKDIEWVKLAAGSFVMGSDRGRDNERPVHVVSLPAFHIARHLVTNRQYASYVAATGVRPPIHWGGGRIPEGRENHPVVFVTWREALGYCDWLSEKMAEQGKSGRVRLPSEAEWEYAAQGIAGREYPWGNHAPDKELCNFNNYVNDTTPVGAYPKGATPEGVQDMAGNVWEWTCSKWVRYPYPMAGRKRNKREDRTGEDHRVLRGCSFRYGAWYARCACRGNAHPAGRHSRVGFRLVLSP
jgi:serine/threonine-protein kinase